MTARDALKRATGDVHDRLDARLSHYRLDDHDGYAGFLRVQAAALLPVERALTKAGAQAVVPAWSEGLRGALLAADLATLGIASPAEVAIPAFDGEAELLGGIYVLEGSRMGAAVLARRVPTGFPRGFLTARAPAGRWRNLVVMLERKLCSLVELDRAKAAARRTFACFELAAEQDRAI